MRGFRGGMACLLGLVAMAGSAAAADLIIDNGSAGTTATGAWLPSVGQNPYGTGSLYNKEASAFYSFEGPATGPHELFMWWTVYSDRGTAIPIEVYDSGVLIDTVSINQQLDGGQWNFLGTYDFSGTARIVVVSEDSSTSTCADAVRLMPLDEGPSVTLTFPASYHLQISRDLLVRAEGRNLENDWGVRFLLNGGTMAEQESIDYSLPYETEFFGLPQAEHTLEAMVIDGAGNEVLSEQARARVEQIGIGAYYVAMGDSITFGYLDDLPEDNISWDGRDRNGGFEPVLNNFLTDLEGIPHHIANEGVGGDLSVDGKDLVAQVLAKHPGAAIFLVQYGTNDSAWWEEVPSGLGLRPGDPGYAGSYKDNMQQIITAIHGAGKEVFLAKVPIVLGESSMSTPFTNPEGAYRNQLIREYNQVIEELVLENQLEIAPPDFYGYFAELNPATGKYRYEEEFADNLHPNGTGYRSMARLWLETIANGPVIIPPPEPWSSRAINFQPAASAVPPGYLADSGNTFNPALGYGWLQGPDSLGPRDRDHSASPDQAHDTLMHAASTAVWEMAVPDGTYQVTVTVGDPAYPDSRHSVQVEGVTAIDGGYLDTETRWIGATVTVAVEDGGLTLTFSGSEPYAKPNWLKIVAVDEPQPPPAAALAVNFQPAASAVPAGYLADSGGLFNASSGYGWIQGPGSLGPRDRDDSASPDQAHDTLMHAASTAVWEMAVPDGTYQVTVMVGDPTYPDSRHSVQVEGVTAIDGRYLEAATRWIEATVTVAVEDGALTLTFAGSEPYAKPDWVKIAAVDGELPPPPAPTAVNFQPAASVAPSGYLVDSGNLFDAGPGYGWLQGPDSLGARDRDHTASPDQAYDTLLHVAPAAVWEMAMPEGAYQVTVTVGDPTYPDSRHTVQVEGITVIDGRYLDAETRWIQGTATVVVEDGALTLTFGGSEPYAKPNWLKIQPLQ